MEFILLIEAFEHDARIIKAFGRGFSPSVRTYVLYVPVASMKDCGLSLTLLKEENG